MRDVGKREICSEEKVKELNVAYNINAAYKRYFYLKTNLHANKVLIARTLR